MDIKLAGTYVPARIRTIGHQNQRVSKTYYLAAIRKHQSKNQREHTLDIAYYDSYREKLKGMITEPGKKPTPKAWQKELDSLLTKYEESKEPYAVIVSTLATIEVLEYNKTDLQRMIENERNEKTQTKHKSWEAI